MLTFLKPEYWKTRKKNVINVFKPPNDPKDKIETSETLLHIYRAPQNIFQEIIFLSPKIKEEFDEEGFFVKNQLFDREDYQNILNFCLHNNVTKM